MPERMGMVMEKLETLCPPDSLFSRLPSLLLQRLQGCDQRRAGCAIVVVVVGSLGYRVQGIVHLLLIDHSLLLCGHLRPEYVEATVLCIALAQVATGGAFSGGWLWYHSISVIGWIFSAPNR